jgi:hypothetical protein
VLECLSIGSLRLLKYVIEKTHDTVPPSFAGGWVRLCRGGVRDCLLLAESEVGGCPVHGVVIEGDVLFGLLLTNCIPFPRHPSLLTVVEALRNPSTTPC